MNKDKIRYIIISTIGILFIFLTAFFMFIGRVIFKDTPRDTFFEERIIRLNNICSQAVTFGTYLESPQVVLGKDNWLFYKSELDGSPVEAYKGLDPLTQEQIIKIVQNINTVHEYCRSRDMDFSFCVIPDKEEIYSEYLPDYIIKFGQNRRISQLMEVIKQNSAFVYTDMTDILLANKDRYKLYFETDTHFNYIGAFLTFQSVYNSIYGICEDIEQVRFRELQGFQGDLVRLGKLGDEFQEEEYVVDVTSLNPALYKNEKLLIIGDSFGEMINTISQNYYCESKWVRIESFDMSVIEEYKPDAIILESVSRYLDKLEEPIIPET